MILILKQNVSEECKQDLRSFVEGAGLEIHESCGMNSTLWGLVGDTDKINKDQVSIHPAVASVKSIQKPYKLANRDMHPSDTVIDICGRKFGGGHFSVIAGPCSIETAKQITEVAEDVKRSGAGLLRGGAFKPRTSPYSFQGLQEHGLELLLEAKRATGLPIVTELMSVAHIDLFEEVDVIQIGTRNMQNFELLKEVGKLNKPILLKRGMCNTLEELLMSAEYIMAGGNEQVILCERGIRTFETSMRNTLDLSAIPMLRKMTHLPIVVDPSHASGLRWMVEPLSMAAIAAGADGLMIEVHNNPEKALCDGAQSLTPQMFEDLMNKIRGLTGYFQKEM